MPERYHPLLWSLLLHVALIGVLGFSLEQQPRWPQAAAPAQSESVRAVAVDSAQIDESIKRLKAREEKRKAEAERKVREEKRRKAEAAKRKKEAQRKAREEKKRKAEAVKRKKEAERKAREEKKSKAEAAKRKKEAERKAREEEKRKEGGRTQGRRRGEAQGGRGEAQGRRGTPSRRGGEA